MTDSILTVLESTKAHLLKSLAMMTTGTKQVRYQGRIATEEEIAEERKLVAEIEAAIHRHHMRTKQS